MLPWKVEQMHPKNPTTEHHVKQNKELMLESMAKMVSAQEIIALEHSDRDLQDEYDYFLLIADGPGYVVTFERADDFGAQFFPGDVVVEVCAALPIC